MVNLSIDLKCLREALVKYLTNLYRKYVEQIVIATYLLFDIFMTRKLKKIV